MPVTAVCCVCGFSGKLEKLNCDNIAEGTPFFPCLKLTSLETFLTSTTKDSHTRPVCVLCHRLFIEQWDNYERNKTPLAARQYWLKGMTLAEDSNSFSPPQQQNEKTSQRQPHSPQKRSAKEIVKMSPTKSPGKKLKPKMDEIEESEGDSIRVCVECGNHFRLLVGNRNLKICEKCRSANSPPLHQ